MSHRRTQDGFAYIAAVVFLVVLAGLALAMLRLQGTQQATIDNGLLGMRADQAARGGLEWAFARLRTADTAVCDAIDGSSGGSGPGQTLPDFRAASGFLVTVKCRSRAYQEGQVVDAAGQLKAQRKVIFEIDATACNGSAPSCPDAASVPRAGYVERRRTASFCGIAPGFDCD